MDTANNIIYGQATSLSPWFVGGPIGAGAAGVPVFPSLYVGIAAAFGAAVLAFFVRRRLIRQE